MCLSMTLAAEYDLKLASLKAENSQLAARVEELSAQVQWFQKQIFGQKSERRVIEQSKEQLFLGEQFQEETGEEETRVVKEHKRKKRKARS
ncbi:MAG: transposase domain-containing protein, partial [Alphaproteobacteria bacterium]